METIAENATPFPNRASTLFCVEFSIQNQNKVSFFPGSSNYKWLKNMDGTMNPYSNGHAYSNYADLTLSGAHQACVRYYGRENFEKLVEVKKKYDPSNVFFHPQSIPVSIETRSIFFNATTLVLLELDSFEEDTQIDIIESYKGQGLLISCSLNDFHLWRKWLNFNAQHFGLTDVILAMPSDDAILYAAHLAQQIKVDLFVVCLRCYVKRGTLALLHDLRLPVVAPLLVSHDHNGYQANFFL